MKKSVVLSVLLVLAGTLVFAKGMQDSTPSGSQKNTVMDVALMINGNLGDKSFHDSANRGMQMLKDQLNCTIKVAEVGYDESKWEPALRDLCDEKHDIIICGTWQMQAIVQKVAPDYPNQKMIVYDTSMDYAHDANGVYKNIYSIEYKQNDGAFLAGVLAAKMSKSGIIGFVGGMDNTVILDFLLGYIQGARAINPNIKVASSFVGNFSDAAKAKELTFAQYQMGADVVFSCASNAGEGTLQASKEKGKFVIGVDSDQSMLYKDTDPQLANLIISSVLKRVDQSIFLAVQSAIKGELAWGSRVALGINEDCVGLADNEFYQKNVPADVRATVSDFTDKIKNGKIKVDTAFGLTSNEINDKIAAVRPY